MGGYPVLGYDPDPSLGRLVVNEGEAEQVREIFAMFLAHGSLAATLEEIHRRGWKMKSWTTRRGKPHSNRSFDRPALLRLLCNVLYQGKVMHQGKVYAGEQAGIVDRAMWKKANDLLESRKRGHESGPRNRPGAMLQDLLGCAVCGGRMVPGYTTKKGRRYRYYVCLTAQKRGVAACPGQSITAPRMERAVVEGLREWAGRSDRVLLREALAKGGWDEGARERGEQPRNLAAIVEGISYDSRSGQAALRLRPEVRGSAESEEIAIPVAKKLAMQPLPTTTTQRVVGEMMGGRLPRITRLMALAVRLEGLLREGTVGGYAELARLGGVSRARVTQIMNLRNLAPAIQEQILWLPDTSRLPIELNERALRRLTRWVDWRQQMKMFEKLWPLQEGRRSELIAPAASKPIES